MAVTKIHAIKATTSKALLYIENPDKTEGNLLVSAYNTEQPTAAIDFEITASAARNAPGAKERRGGISDRLCTDAELSVIGSPQQLGQQYSDYIKKRKQTPILERYKATVRTNPNTPDTMVTLSAGQIVKSTSRGLVVQTEDKNGNTATLMVERE